MADEKKDESRTDDDSPEARMARRFPQKVLVGALIGLRVVDDDNREFATIRQVVRTPAGKIVLIVDYGGWFGIGARMVAVPIEVVAIVGKQVASMDLQPTRYARAPTWVAGTDAVLAPETTIRIALTRR